jgi:polyisoprenoid-binding protein YceI
MIMAFRPCPLCIVAGAAVIFAASASPFLLCDELCGESEASSEIVRDVTSPGAVATLEPLPDMPAGAYDVDSVHSTALFRVQHMGSGLFWGRFNDVTGTVTFTPEGKEHFAFDINIDLESVDSGNSKLDGHLKSPDFFNAKEFKNMTFKSTAVERLGQTVWDVTGDLTMNGVTKPVIAVVRFTGTAEISGRRCGFEAEFDINRSDFAHNWGIENGALGNKVRVIVGLEAVKAPDA